MSDIVTATVLTTEIAEGMRAVKRKYWPIVTGLVIVINGGAITDEVTPITLIVVLGMPIVLVAMPIILLPTVMLEIVMIEIVTGFTIEIVMAFIVVAVGMSAIVMSS